MPSGLGLEKTSRRRPPFAPPQQAMGIHAVWPRLRADLLVEFEDLSSSVEPVNFRHYKVHDNDVWMKATSEVATTPE
jgi:hypothetical protein